MAGPVSNDYIFLAPGLNVADHNTVLTHEVIHQYQARTLGSYTVRDRMQANATRRSITLLGGGAFDD